MDDVASETAADQPRTALLIDVSASTRNSETSPVEPDYVDALTGEMEIIVQEGAMIAVAGFGGQSSTFDWVAKDRSVRWQGTMQNPENLEDRRAEAQGCVADLVRSARSSVPTAAETDILNAMKSAARWLGREGDARRRLVVVTDGLATTGCTDLRKSAIRRSSEIDAIVDICTERKSLEPRAFAGIEVRMLGIGRPGSAHAMPDDQQRLWLKKLWTQICKAGQAAACHVETDALSGVADQGSGSERASAPSSQPPDTAVRLADKQVFSLPAAALFATAAVKVREGAVPRLERIATSIRTGSYRKVTVNGFADYRGSKAYNVRLSQRRADAVGDILRTYGVQNVQAHGRGETTSCPDRWAAAAHTSGLQCSRRVDIVVT